MGLKAGLFAGEVLGLDGFRTRAVVETEPFPPFSCVVDGVQVATGCTMGKGSIELRRGNSLLVTFMKDGERLRLCLKDDVLENLKSVSSLEESERMALALLDKPVQELFDIQR